MVSAFAARQRHVLDQVKVADKANEIVAIPRLLDLLAIEKDSLRLRRKVAAWDDDFLVSLLAG
jgi:predicted transposase YbfD/YdcC